MTAPDVMHEARRRMRSTPPPQERHESYGDFAKALIVGLLLIVAIVVTIHVSAAAALGPVR